MAVKVPPALAGTPRRLGAYPAPARPGPGLRIRPVGTVCLAHSDHVPGRGAGIRSDTRTAGIRPAAIDPTPRACPAPSGGFDGQGGPEGTDHEHTQRHHRPGRLRARQHGHLHRARFQRGREDPVPGGQPRGRRAVRHARRPRLQGLDRRRRQQCRRQRAGRRRRDLVGPARQRARPRPAPDRHRGHQWRWRLRRRRGPERDRELQRRRRIHEQGLPALGRRRRGDGFGRILEQQHPVGEQVGLLRGRGHPARLHLQGLEPGALDEGRHLQLHRHLQRIPGQHQCRRLRLHDHVRREPRAGSAGRHQPCHHAGARCRLHQRRRLHGGHGAAGRLRLLHGGCRHPRRHRGHALGQRHARRQRHDHLQVHRHDHDQRRGRGLLRPVHRAARGGGRLGPCADRWRQCVDRGFAPDHGDGGQVGRHVDPARARRDHRRRDQWHQVQRPRRRRHA